MEIRSRSGTVLLDGTRVQYRETGPRNAPALVMIHTSLASDIHTSIERLVRGFNIFSLKLPRFCRKSTSDGKTIHKIYNVSELAELVERTTSTIGLAHFVVYACGKDAMIANCFADRFPGKVAAVISQTGNPDAEITELLINTLGQSPQEQDDRLAR